MTDLYTRIIAALQFFADAGTMTNVGYATDTNNHAAYQVNSYTGAVELYNTGFEFAPELKDYYDTQMLENYRIQQRYVQLAKRVYLPAGHGTTMEFRKWNTFARAGKLQEGVIPTGQKWGATAKTASIDQYGTYVTLSDKLKRHTYDDATKGAYEEMGESAAQTEEILCRDALAINTNVLYCDNVDATGAVQSTPTTPQTVAWNSTDGYSKLTPTMVNKAKTKMVKDKVKPFADGKFVAVIHPSVAFDLREDPHWIDAHKYMAATEIFNGEIGELHGVRFIEDVEAPIIKGATAAEQNKEGGALYYTYFFGKDPFVSVDAEGGALQMIVHDQNEIGGPLNQFSTIGYKLDTNGATVLYTERVLRVVSASSFQGTDVAN